MTASTTPTTAHDQNGLKRTLVFMRHGSTNYTDEFPDLTPDGIRQAKQAAEELKPLIEGKNVWFRSSPAVRACGTMKTMFPDAEFLTESAIRRIDFYDEPACLKLFASFGVHHNVDIGYHSDPRFENTTIMEKRSEVQRRFWTYLAHLYETFDRVPRELPDVIIHVTHCEVLWDLATRTNQGNYVSPGEFMVLELSKVGRSIKTAITFRRETVEFEAAPPMTQFRRSFAR